MLVLSRRARQRVFLRCQCGLTTLEVLDITTRLSEKPKVRLGIDAPETTVIVLEELERREDDAA